MSWPMGGPWNPGMASMPQQNMGMSGYTPDQWAAMQQNWQWSQWQQYSQWQSQYGNKFGQQMPSMQIAPPLPPNPVPPPGPPPEVPPPPPHENNKPLYAQPEPPANNQTAQMSTNNMSWRGNEQTQPQTLNEPGNQNNFAASSQPHVSEDLQKLNEEERQFDIQFKKWEEEVEEWRQKNVSHPDKETYKKYEETFLTFRAELLERRKQMQLRRSSLMKDNVPNVKNNTRKNIINAPVIYNQPSTNVDSNRPNINVSQLPYNQNRNEYNPMNRGPLLQHNNSTMGNNIISIPTNQNNTSNIDTNTSPFVQINRSSQGIPGLDLVPAANKPAKIPQLMNIKVNTDNIAPALQEFSEISKGINNILGDEKIMNILSAFRNNSTNQQNDNGSNLPQSTFGQVNKNLNDSNQNMNQNFHNNNKWNTNQIENKWNTNQNEMSNNEDFQNDNEYQDEQFQDDQYHEDQYQGDEYQDDPYRDDEYQTNQCDNDQYQNDQYQNDQYQNDSFQNDSYNDGPHGLSGYPTQPLMQRHNENTPRPFPSNANRNARGLYQQRQPGVVPYSEQKDLQSPIVRRNSELAFGNVENLPPKAPPVKPVIEEPMFVASIIVDYAHKPARLKDRGFLEPAHVFEYNHMSKTNEYKSLDFDSVSRKEFLSKDRRDSESPRKESHRDRDRADRRLFDGHRDSRDRHTREGSREDRRRHYYDRRSDENGKRDNNKYDDRKKLDDDRRKLEDERRKFDYDKRRFDDREKFTRREEPRDRYRAKKYSRSGSRELEHVSEPKIMKIDDNSVKVSRVALTHLIMIDDILESPGREMRPERIVIILRGPPGSGKSYLAKLIRDKEAENDTSVRILSIDDYFQQETEVTEEDPTTGRMVKKTVIKYEYDADSEEEYNASLRRSFKRTITDGFFQFLIVDAINEHLKHYAEMWNHARQCGFQVYICTMELDPLICYKRNIHNRTLEEIKEIAARFTKTPAHHIVLDPTTLLQSAAIQEVDMEDVTSDNDVTMEDVHEELFCSINKFQDTPSQASTAFTSKWEKMDDMTQLARLDGTSKPLRPSKLSMEDYLQLDDWQPTHRAQPGKKTVRWADIEERRQQEKMRAIGFVVGQTDWNRMTDPTMGSSALTQTKYIERVRRKQ